MEPDGLLPCSQEPATGPYPELFKSRSHPRTLFIIMCFEIIHKYETPDRLDWEKLSYFVE
jgi:hypothetical protein